MQYDGYCSICYRKIKNAARPAHLHQATGSNLQMFTSSPSFDDSSSLLSSSFSFNSNDQFNNQIWNEQKNLSKFSSKKEAKNSGKSSLKSIFKRPPPTNASTSEQTSPYKHSSSTLNLAETLVSKVADKAVNLVDQSLFNLTHSSSSSSLGNADTANSLIEFNNCLNKLLTPTPSNTNVNIFAPSHSKLNSSYYDNNTVLNEFEELFKLNFPQFYSDLNKQLKQFVDKFLEAFKQQQRSAGKDKQSNDNMKQSDVVQEFFKKIYKYVLTSASIKSHLEKLNAVVSVSDCYLSNRQ